MTVVDVLLSGWNGFKPVWSRSKWKKCFPVFDQIFVDVPVISHTIKQGVYTGKRFGQITRQCLITLFDRQRFPLIWTGLKEVEFLWFLLHFPCVFLWDHLVIYLEWRYFNLKLKRQKVSVDKLSVCGLACEYSRLLFAPATACETRRETKGKNENTHLRAVGVVQACHNFLITF